MGFEGLKQVEDEGRPVDGGCGGGGDVLGGVFEELVSAGSGRL